MILYTCMICAAAKSEEAWNEATYKHCLGKAEGGWSTDKAFYPLSKEYELEEDGAWFHCPACDYLHNNMLSIRRKDENIKNNKQAATLLEKSW